MYVRRTNPALMVCAYTCLKNEQKKNARLFHWKNRLPNCQHEPLSFCHSKACVKCIPHIQRYDDLDNRAHNSFPSFGVVWIEEIYVYVCLSDQKLIATTQYTCKYTPRIPEMSPLRPKTVEQSSSVHSFEFSRNVRSTRRTFPWKL